MEEMLKDVRKGRTAVAVNKKQVVFMQIKKSQVTTNQLLTISTKNIFINKLKLFLNICTLIT
jgi:hypothetical protein